MKRALFGVLLVFSMLLIVSSAAFASEPRINVLTGGNDLSMPEDDLDVYNFPHTLASKGGFVYADETSNYIAYAGDKWIASINRSNTGMNNIGLQAEPIIDLGYSNGSTGIIANIGLTKAGRKTQVLSLGARGSIGSDGKALAVEIAYRSDDSRTDKTSLVLGGDARLEIDHEHFKYLIISGQLDSKAGTNMMSAGTGTDIEVGALLADNDMVTDTVRLLYGIGVGLEKIDKATTAITIPAHIGAEIEAKNWLTLRAGGTREWRMDSLDKTTTATGKSETTYTLPPANIAFGSAITIGALTVDMTLNREFLRDGFVFENDNVNNPQGGALSAHTALTYSF